MTSSELKPENPSHIAAVVLSQLTQLLFGGKDLIVCCFEDNLNTVFLFSSTAKNDGHTCSVLDAFGRFFSLKVLHT